MLILPHRRYEFTERKKPEREREELIIELQKASDEFYGKEGWYIEMKNEEQQKNNGYVLVSIILSER